MKRGLLVLLGLLTGGILSAQIIQSENFNGCALPAGWTENILSGTQGWLFVSASPDLGNPGNIDGSCMVLFDDDWLGSAAPFSTVELVSPAVDITGFSLVNLEFDYNLQEYGPAVGDGFTVDVWDGSAWVTVYSVTDLNDCGAWTCGPPYPHAEIDVTAYANPGFQVRFTYNDGSEWAWYFGMDNFQLVSPPSDDVGVSAVLQPVGGGCSIGPAQPVEVEIENFGSAPATGFDVCFEVDGPGGLSSVCENVGALSIAPGATATYLFTATADLSLPGAYTVTGYTNLIGDGIPENDSASATLGLSVILPSFTEDFDPYVDGTTAFPEWNNDLDADQLQWEVNFGGTSSTATGPSDDVSIGGGYIYTETSSAVAGDSAILVSDCIDLGALTAPVLEFSYHMFGLSIDYLRVEVINTLGVATTEWIQVGQVQTASADPWLAATVDLSAYAGQIVQIRFTGKCKLDPSGFVFNGDIGLDEIAVREVSGDDLGVSDILSPELVGCGLSATESVEVEITNVGSAAQTGFDVCYALAGPTGSFSGCENVGALVVPAVGGTGNYTFATALDFSLPGVYTLTAYTNLPGDGDNANDTTTVVIDIPSPEALPIEEDFNGYADGSLAFATPLSNSADDDLDWQVNFGATGSVATGPDDDVSGGGGYIYMETSGSAIGDVTILESACLDLTGGSNPLAGFSYHMAGGSIDSLVFEIIDGSSTVTPLVILDKAQQANTFDPWLDTVVDLTPYIGQVVRLRWKGFVRADPVDGVTTFRGDIALDEILVEDPLPDDIGVASIDAPMDGCSLSAAEAVSITIENYGTTDITGFDVAYAVDGGPAVVENVGALFIPVGGMAAYTFATPVDLSADGAYALKAWTELAGDGSAANDTAYATVENLAAIAAFPYTETFDAFSTCSDAAFACVTDGTCAGSTTGGWVQASGDDIDWSVTNLASTPSGGTGPSAGDHTSGSGIYLFTEASGCSNQVAILESPCFDLGAVTCPQVSFWYHMSGINMGTMTLEINAGSGWDTLWVASGDQGGAWQQASVSLAAYTGLGAQFRITGRTGPGFESDMSIDDFSVTDNGLDVGVASVDAPVSGCEVGLVDVTVTLENGSCLAAPSFDAVLEVDGAVIATDTYPAGLAGLGTASHTFSVPFDFAAVGSYAIKAYTVLPGDANADNDTANAVVSSVLPPAVNTGFETNYCIGTSTFFPDPLIPGGTWSGTGIINPATGEFDPALVGGGTTTDITYTFTPTGAYSVAEIPYGPAASVAPVPVTLFDDDDATVPIGFNFEFFGNAYSSINIHSNGYLSFNSDLNFTVGTPLPTPSEPNELIAFAWDDWNPSDGGTITYETTGTAPNRTFVVTFSGVPHFGSGGALTMTVQTILYEGSNIIDLQVTDITSDGGNRTQGIENAGGTEGYTSTPATNFTNFTQSNVAYRYAPTPCGATVTETITVDPAPVLSLGSDTTLCAGDSGLLDAGSGFSTYAWSTGATTPTITVSASGTYSVTVSDPLGCLAAGSIDVTVSDPIVIGGDKVNVDCIGEATGSFNLNVTGGTGPYTIIWSTGATGPVLTGLPAGDYGVAVVDANGCTASGTENIREPFDYRVDLTAEDASFGGADGEISANVVGGNPPYTFLWSDGQTGNPATGLTPGTYSVTVTDDAGCTTTAEITVGQASGLDGIASLDAFEVFPNPSTGAFTVRVRLNTAEDVTVDVRNVLGQQVVAARGERTLGRDWSFNLEDVAAGQYSVRLIVGDRSVQVPLVITR
jgi:hypothetical protein